MGNRKFWVVIIIIIFGLIVGYTIRVEAEANSLGALTTAFLGTGATYSGTELCGWTIKKNQHYSLAELEKWGKGLAEEYDLDWERIELIKVEEESYTALNYQTVFDGEGELRFSAQSSLDRDEQGKVAKETYLVVTIATPADLSRVSLQSAQLVSFLKSIGGKQELTYNIHGTYSRFLADQEKDDLLERFFYLLKGETKQQIKDKNYWSITGYSPVIKEKIELGKENINVQLALTNYEADQKTYLIVGCPLISIEY